ncbi:MAG: class II fructose-bisphosphate aldolase [Deltaproteobacteria bacterium]|nr:class II fructose-bisphosphate aldolase [Deltaproteobacteria bacterium]
MEYKTVPELLASLKDCLKIQSAQNVQILSRKNLHQKLIDDLVWNAVFNVDQELKNMTRALIRNIARAAGVYPASIQSLYEAIGQGKVGHFTTPAINIRGLTYDLARTIFKAQIKKKAFPVVFELARSEMGYTFQTPAEYATCVLAAAVKEGYKGAVFIQGDHFQVSAKKYAKEPEFELQAIRGLIDEGIAYGFFNIDIDTSTLVDLSQPTVKEQQRVNFELCADFTNYIRQREPRGVTISVGGEIGEVGGKNSTVEEFEIYMEGYKETLARENSKAKGGSPKSDSLKGGSPKGAKGITKISVQTGTSHGGIPLADGTVAKVKIDFDVLKNIGAVARKKYGMAGAVQHGASTLPEELFDKFPEVGATEIHLATEFQNMIYNHELFPEALKQEIYSYLRKEMAGEKKEGETEEQFLYKTRKKGFGPFKKQIWSLPEKTRGGIMEKLQAKFEFLFDKLNVSGREAEVAKFVKIADIPLPLPNSLRPAS